MAVETEVIAAARQPETAVTRGSTGSASPVTVFAALFAAAAFVCSLPYCQPLIGHWAPAATCIGAAALLALARRPHGTFCLCLGLTALALRLAWALSIHSLPYDDWLAYRRISLDGLRGDWQALLHTQWAWGYPLWLYALARLFGTSPDVPLIANAGVGAATTLLVYALAERLYPERNARVAAVIYALWPGVIYWSSLLCTEILHLFLYAAALLCLIGALDAPPCSGGEEDARLAVRLWGSPKGRRLLVGGALAALAEFVRPLSPLLLLPFAFYAWTRRGPPLTGSPATQGQGRRDAVTALTAYALCLAALLALKSLATGYPNFIASYALGSNLACGLNWQSGGNNNEADENLIYVSEDPREVNRIGMRLALQRLAAIRGPNGWRVPALVFVKFPKIWSVDETGYFANASGLPSGEKRSHWLTTRGGELLALAQFFHSAVLALAAVGLWRSRGSRGAALLSSILVAFALVHALVEANDRYHFAPQLLFAVLASGAFSFEKCLEVPQQSRAGNCAG